MLRSNIAAAFLSYFKWYRKFYGGHWEKWIMDSPILTDLWLPNRHGETPALGRGTPECEDYMGLLKEDSCRCGYREMMSIVWCGKCNTHMESAGPKDAAVADFVEHGWVDTKTHSWLCGRCS